MPPFTSKLKPGKGSLILCLLSFILIASAACSNPSASESPARVEASPEVKTATTATPNATPATTEPISLPPPKPAEVQDAIARIYQNAVAVETSREFIVGDFNGDDSQDIAVTVKPAKDKLPEITSELANWIVEDPRQPDSNPGGQTQARPKPLKIKPDDLLIAIIHGYKTEGWRNAEARQSYLLVNAAAQAMTVQSTQALQDSIGGNIKLNRQSGDVIKETLGGTPGFIYWTGAKYAWHQLKGTGEKQKIAP